MEKRTLIKANILHRKGGFLSILILIFFVSLTLSTVLSVNQNIENRWDEAAKKAKVADINAIAKNKEFTAKEKAGVKANKNISSIELEQVLTMKTKIKKKRSSGTVFFGDYSANEKKYSYYNAKGNGFIENPEPLKQGEIYVPISLKQIYGCVIGDQIRVLYDDTSSKFTIKGFMEEPLTGGQTIGMKYVLIPHDDFCEFRKKCKSEQEMEKQDRAAGRKLSYVYQTEIMKIYQKTSSHLNPVQLKKKLNDQTGVIDDSMLVISAKESKSYTGMFNDIMSGILSVFAILLYVIVLVVISHSIASSVEMDYKNLGILEACGFTLGKLRLIYLLQYLIVSGIGILLGILCSIPVIRIICSMFVPITGLLAGSQLAMGKNFLVLGALFVFCGFLVLWKTGKIKKVSPVAAISGKEKDVYFVSRLQNRINGNYLNISITWRQITSNIKQYISVIIIAAILTFFILAIGSLKGSMNITTAAEQFGMVEEHLAIQYHEDDKLQKEVEREIEQRSKIKKSFSKNNAYFMVNGQDYIGVISSDWKFFSSTIDGRAPKYVNEIVMTEILADELGVHIGDKVKIGLGNKTKKMLIVGTVTMTNDAGYCFGITLQAVHKNFDAKYKMPEVSYVLEKDTKASGIAKYLSKKYGDQLDVKDCTEDTMLETIFTTVDFLTIMIYVASTVFVFIVSYMVSDKILMKEQTDLGIYRTLGFTDGRIRRLFSMRFFLIAMMGICFGFLLSILLNDVLMSNLFRSVGISQFHTKYQFLYSTMPVLIVAFGFAIFSYLISAKVKRLSVRDLSQE